MRFCDFSRQINLLNIILALGLTWAATETILPLLQWDVKIPLPAAGMESLSLSPVISAPSRPPAMSDFMVIAEQNLFHQTRKIPAGKKDEKQLPKPEFVLYGILLDQNEHTAYMEDKKNPYASPGRGARQRTVRLGEMISGFVLSAVEMDKVVLTRGDEKVVVLLNEKKERKPVKAGTGAKAP